MRPKVIAVDFDDTLFEYNHLPNPADDYSGRPNSIGEPIWSVINSLKEEQKGGAVIILWTCREGLALTHAIEACDKIGLHFDYINENADFRKSTKWPDCRKIKADEYWDDRAFRKGKI